MSLLPPVEQIYAVNAAAYLAGVNEMLAENDRLVASIDAVAVSSERMGGVTAAADTAAADATRVLTDAERLEAEIAATAADVQKQLADARLVSVDATLALARADGVLATREAEAGTAAESATAKTSAMGAHGKTTFLGIAAAAAYSVVKAAQYQAEMTKLLTQAGVAKSQFKGLEQGVLQLAGQIGQSPTSLAESLFHIESNFASLGISAPKALSLVKIAAEGANVGGAGLVDVTNALTAAVASGIPGVQNYGQAMGMLNAIVGSGDMTMQNLAEAFGSGLVAVVKGYGLTLRDVGAGLATFGDNNIRGAVAATDLRMAVQSLAVPMKTAAPLLARLGMNSQTLATDMRQGGLLKALDDLTARFHKAGISAKMQGDVITQMFGKKAGSGLAVLLDQMDRLRSKYPKLAQGAHDFGKAWATTQGTVQQRFKEFRAGVDALAISFGTILLPAVTKILGYVNRFLQALQNHPVLAEFAGALVALAVAMGVATAASGALTAALAIDPVVLAVMAVVALAAGLYELYKHCSWVRRIVADVARFFVTAWKDAMHIAGEAIKWFTSGPLAFIKQQIAQFKTWWSQNSKEIEQVWHVVWAHIKLILEVAWAVIKADVRVGLATLKALWTIGWGLIRDTVKLVWNTMAVTIRTAIKVIQDIIAVVLDVITGHWSKAWHDLLKLSGDVAHGIVSIVQAVLGGLGHLLWDLAVNAVRGFIGGIKSMFGAVGSVVSSLVSGAVSAAKSLLGMHSPSRVFHDIGYQAGLGFANGITASSGLAEAAADRLARAAVYAARHAATLAAQRLKEMHAIGLGLRAGILAGLEGTASQVKAAISKIVGYIAAAVRVGIIGYPRGLRMTDWVERDNTRLQNLANRRTAILKTIAAAEKYAASTTASVQQWAGLTGLSSVSAASGGGSVLYSGNILADLQAKLATIRNFASDLRKLAKLGLSKSLLNQIIQAGPDQGSQIAQALLNGPVSVIRSMNATQAQIDKAAGGLGRTAAELMYDSGRQAGKGFLSGLEAQRHAITRLMNKIARDMIRALREALGISSPSKVAIWHGQMFAQGLAIGLDSGHGQITTSAMRLAEAMASGRPGGAGGAGSASGGQVINHYHFEPHIQGFIGNEQQLAQHLMPQIQRWILQLNKRNPGNMLSLSQGRFG